jgi:hypothetical protein
VYVTVETGMRKDTYFLVLSPGGDEIIRLREEA